MDMYYPVDFSESAPTVIVASSSVNNSVRAGECFAIPLVDINTGNAQSLGIVGVVAQYLSQLRGVKITPPSSTPVMLITPPKHGKFIVKAPDDPGGWPDYKYLADKDFRGKDNFTVRVDIDGESVEWVILVAVAGGDDDMTACERAYGKNFWKIFSDGNLMPRIP